MSFGRFGSMRQVVVTAGSAVGITLMAVGTAAAHVGGAPASGFAAGFAHPFSGLDHVLALVAMGLWAAQQTGRSRWVMPAAFLAAMVGGALLGIAGIRIPMTEQGIVLSVVVLGTMVAMAARPPLVFAIGLPAVFALFHGHAHGSELPAGLTAAPFIAGFATATLVLQAIGFGLATALRTRRRRTARTLVRQRNFA